MYNFYLYYGNFVLKSDESSSFMCFLTRHIQLKDPSIKDIGKRLPAIIESEEIKFKPQIQLKISVNILCSKQVFQ
ncbi:CLUMA_CG012061, isoform A [Clunio marinus]|uniref:CLUMA_CG012061, isoform A n=1 Tax=Clunio marinus TaxID=568069 RepID=A0A1J1IER3_9DIPT|nr:CLUMA_CG012061, isoform A [Clunio marinus]